MKNKGASVFDKLTKLSKSSGRSFQELLLYYAMERFLARLSQSPEKDKFILKGALLLHVISPGLSRATRDIDLLGRFNNDLESAGKRISEVCSFKIDDGVDFDHKNIEVSKFKEDADYEGVRASFHARVASARIPLQVDIGFGDAITPKPERCEYPRLLETDPFNLIMYPRETVVAEKLEAMVKLDMANSRMKDFFDVWFLARAFDFNGPTLTDAIQATFNRRKTELPGEPTGLTEAFWTNLQKKTQWRAFRKRLNVAAPEELAEVGQEISKFLLPPISAMKGAATFKKSWKDGVWT